MSTVEALTRLRALRGAPLSIVMALVIAGPDERLLVNELAGYTGYHREAISAGLQALKSLGAVRYHGHYQGWSLNADWRQFVITGCVHPVDNLADNSNGHHKTLPEKPSMSEKPAISSSATLPEKPALTEKPAVLSQNIAGKTVNVGKTGNVWGDHDHVDHVVVDDVVDTNNNNIARASLAARLAELRPPFDNGDAFLAEQPATLISAWLDYLDALSPADRRKLTNESAFLRRRVQQRRTPPEARQLPPAVPAEYAGLIQT